MDSRPERVRIADAPPGEGGQGKEEGTQETGLKSKQHCSCRARSEGDAFPSLGKCRTAVFLQCWHRRVYSLFNVLAVLKT